MTTKVLSIGFAGSLPSKRVEASTVLWNSVAYKIGYILAQRGHRMVCGGCSGGPPHHAAAGVKKSLDEMNIKTINESVISYIPEYNDNSIEHGIGLSLKCMGHNDEERRKVLSQNLDVLITIGGGAGTKDEAKISKINGKQVIPLGATGGTSSKLWSSLNEKPKDSILTEEEIARIGTRPLSEDSKDTMSYAEKIVNIIERVCGVQTAGNIRKSEFDFICNVLKHMERSFARWPEGDTGWRIENESHVQSLIWAVLSPMLDDLRSEMYMVGKSEENRIADFAIESLGLIIEVKFWRSGKGDMKRVVEEIRNACDYIDGRKFEKLIVFVWDNGQNTPLHADLKRNVDSINDEIELIIVSRPGIK